jgi:aarF domain-containing kinase
MTTLTHSLAFVDHGLYVSLSPAFRSKYSQLWYAIFIQDLPTIRKICEGWGIGQAELFASATLLKPWKAPTSKHETGLWKHSLESHSSTKEVEMMKLEEREKLEQQRALETQRQLKDKLKTFLQDVELIPKELIFIGRTMRILQANNQATGTFTSPNRQMVFLALNSNI